MTIVRIQSLRFALLDTDWPSETMLLSEVFSKLVFKIVAVGREPSGFGALKNWRARALPLRIRLQMNIENALEGRPGKRDFFWKLACSASETGWI